MNQSTRPQVQTTISDIYQRLHGPYRNSPLDTTQDCIRLFRVARSQLDRIEFQLRTFVIDAAPPYRALSYTWGSQEYPQQQRKAIYVEGCMFPISPNLYAFLKLYGQRCFGEWIWIDQVREILSFQCINVGADESRSASTRVQQRNGTIKLCLCQGSTPTRSKSLSGSVVNR